MPASIGIETGYSGGVNKVLVARVNTQHLFVQFIMTLLDILLVIIFSFGKGPKRYYFGFNDATNSLLHGGFGSQCQLVLLLVVIEDRIHVLPRPRLLVGPVALPENF